MKTKALRLIESDKDLMSKINNLSYYDIEMFIKDVKAYIKAIKEGRMVCVIDSVSSSGMSRNIHFHSCEGSKGKFSYRQFWSLFKVLGYTEAKGNSFRIGGCGMDMIFHTNYTNIHKFCRLGFITKKDCEILCQKTPTIL